MENMPLTHSLGTAFTSSCLRRAQGRCLACIESGENTVNGKTESVSIRSSTVFRKEGGAWKVIAHQTDRLDYMNKP
ncbi:MAG: hypothetical protein NTZ79_09905 [Proteobacteria bacterium]|nr:hypothetical protein [Pseudomonadota bacterium]